MLTTDVQVSQNELGYLAQIAALGHGLLQQASTQVQRDDGRLFDAVAAQDFAVPMEV